VFIADNASAEQETVNKRILDEQDDSHWFVITSNKSGVPAPDLVRSLKFIDF